MTRQSYVEVDLNAIAHNANVLVEATHPAPLCAVVKANGYGHGAAPAARAALAGGAATLGVASVEEGVELRDAGLTAPILVLGPQPDGSMGDAVAHEMDVIVTSSAELRAIAEVHAARRVDRPTRVHVMVDTGMRRVGVEPDDTHELWAEAERLAGVEPVAVATHFARADEPGDPTTDHQLVRFEQARAHLRAKGVDPPLIHAANSAAAVTRPDARFGMVRCGILLYGLAASTQLADLAVVRRLRPAARVISALSLVKQVAAGEGVSYGHSFVTNRPSTLATVPIGYGDGVPRALGLTGAMALVGGVRRPVAGVVTMDQLVLDCTDGPPVQLGDEVVLLGKQSVEPPGRGESIGAWEWAERLDTIAYEIVTRLGPRLPRRYLGGAALQLR